MLISIGKKRTGEGLLELLTACHARIRHFAKLAHEIARRPELTPDETIARCHEVQRYFAEALPLHVADEEESLLPRLRGRRAAIDDALTQMHVQHTQHEPLLSALDRALSAVAAQPGDAAERARLEAVAAPLGPALEYHLALEEREIFPALAQLDPATEAAIVRELRARRS